MDSHPESESSSLDYFGPDNRRRRGVSDFDFPDFNVSTYDFSAFFGFDLDPGLSGLNFSGSGVSGSGLEPPAAITEGDFLFQDTFDKGGASSAWPRDGEGMVDFGDLGVSGPVANSGWPMFSPERTSHVPSLLTSPSSTSPSSTQATSMFEFQPAGGSYQGFGPSIDTVPLFPSPMISGMRYHPPPPPASLEGTPWDWQSISPFSTPATSKFEPKQVGGACQEYGPSMANGTFFPSPLESAVSQHPPPPPASLEVTPWDWQSASPSSIPAASTFESQPTGKRPYQEDHGPGFQLAGGPCQAYGPSMANGAPFSSPQALEVSQYFPPSPPVRAEESPKTPRRGPGKNPKSGPRKKRVVHTM